MKDGVYSLFFTHISFLFFFQNEKKLYLCGGKTVEDGLIVKYKW